MGVVKDSLQEAQLHRVLEAQHELQRQSGHLSIVVDKAQHKLLSVCARPSYIADWKTVIIQIHMAGGFLGAGATLFLSVARSSHLVYFVSCRQSLGLGVAWLGLGKRLVKSSLLQDRVSCIGSPGCAVAGDRSGK